MPFETRGVERRENARAPASERAITAFRHSPASPSAPRVDESSGAPRLLFGEIVVCVWLKAPRTTPTTTKKKAKNFSRKNASFVSESERN